MTRPKRNIRHISYTVSDSESEEVEEEEEVYTSRPHKKQKQKAKKKSRGENDASFRDQGAREDFPSNYLYAALSNPDASSYDLAISWLKDFEDNKDTAIKEIVNFILCSSGCFYQVEEHDIANIESCVDTIGEIQLIFTKQKSHEFPFISKNKQVAHFSKNLIEFFQNIIYASNENDMIFDDDLQFFEILLTWLSPLSSSNIRCLRLVTTTALLNIATILTELIAKKISLIEKNKRQLDSEMSKSRKHSKKVATITQNIENYQNEKKKLDELIKDVVDTTFIHRYRDIDQDIRNESMIHLGNWMKNYPEFFYSSNYLRYFGWLLTDESTKVRLTIIKELTRLFKQKIVVGFRQFLERFKPILIKMCMCDNIKVKSVLFPLFSELVKSGFLEDDEIVQLLDLTKIESLNISSFVRAIEKTRTENLMEKYTFDVTTISSIDVSTILKYITLFNLIPDMPSTNTISAFKKLNAIYSDHEILLNYFLFDLSSIPELSSDLKSEIELDNRKRELLLYYLISSVDSIKPKLIKSLLQIQKSLNQNEVAIFLKLFNILGYESFQELDQKEIHDEVYEKLADYFFESFSNKATNTNIDEELAKFWENYSNLNEELKQKINIKILELFKSFGDSVDSEVVLQKIIIVSNFSNLWNYTDSKFESYFMKYLNSICDARFNTGNRNEVIDLNVSEIKTATTTLNILISQNFTENSNGKLLKYSKYLISCLQIITDFIFKIDEARDQYVPQFKRQEFMNSYSSLMIFYLDCLICFKIYLVNLNTNSEDAIMSDSEDDEEDVSDYESDGYNDQSKNFESKIKSTLARFLNNFTNEDVIVRFFILTELRYSSVSNIELGKVDNIAFGLDLDVYDFNSKISDEDDDNDDDDDDEIEDNSDKENQPEHSDGVNETRRKKRRSNNISKQDVWESEQNLCLYAVKLAALNNLKLLSKKTVARIELNKKDLGNLFNEIVNFNNTRIPAIAPFRAIARAENNEENDVEVDEERVRASEGPENSGEKFISTENAESFEVDSVTEF